MTARGRVTIALFAAVGVTRAWAADAGTAQRDLLAGQYARAVATARDILASAPGDSAASLVLIRGLLTLGRNSEADAALQQALERDPMNIQLRWLSRDVAYANDRPEQAAARPDEIRRIVASRPWFFRAPADMVVFGRAALALGADPRDVLDKVYAVAQAADPKSRDVYLARGELALEKHDFALAAKAFEEGLKVWPNDPDLLCGRARAYVDSDHKTAQETLQEALKANPGHIPSLLLAADHDIDAEAYAEAEKVLELVFAVNKSQPDAWAYRAALAHLRNDAAAEQQARAEALRTWRTNPRVDYLIGKKLAQKYRFAEAAEYQRNALHFDPGNLPASAELATDLLRLGDEAEGWNLVQNVRQHDEYDVEAFNLTALQQTMAKYATLSADDFVLRMSPAEVAIYGPRALALLRRARETLTRKYGVELANPTYVEVFADQKDFAVRTFGLPDIPGFLGVCFGRVVTANSPATGTGPTNWQSVLWHEFCHVVTLQLTKNKMPRWLSEGISVYEERQANPSWGMRLDAADREMILGEDFVPVGKLSAAFLEPKTPEHLQFAYLESSLVVEFIVDRYGLEKLRAVLRDLRDGAEINAALAKDLVPLPELESAFAAFAQERATQLGPKLDWEKPDPELLLASAAKKLAAWERVHPDNYWLLKFRASQAMHDERWPEARRTLERLVELLPSQKGADTAYRPLAKALRELGDEAAERAVLVRWAAIDDEAPDAYLRLMELAAAAKDWPTVKENADRYLGVNPLVAAPYRLLAKACEATGDVSGAVAAWRTLVQLDPPDPSDAHYQLARLLHARGENADAKRQVLMALEETPRFRAALQLLTEIERNGPTMPVAPNLNLAPAIDLPPRQ